VAVDHKLSDDKRVWTFTLRKEAKWSNGDPVTAHDFVFSWRRMLEDPGEYTYLFFYIKNAKSYSEQLQAYFTEPKRPRPSFDDVGIKALEDHTFVVTLTDPVPYLLELVAFPPFYPRHAKSMEPFKTQPDAKTGKYSYKAEYTRPPHVVTNGPFVLTKWEFKKRLLLEKSDTYWDRANVKSSTVEMVVSESPLAKFLLYESGKVDWNAEVEGDLAAELQARKRTDLRHSMAFGTAFLTVMCKPELPSSIPGGGPGVKNPLADSRVRRALAMSIDKRFIVDNITRMGELPARTYVPPDGTLDRFTFLPGPYDKNRTDRYSAEEMRKRLTTDDGLNGNGPGLPYDVQEARRLLAEAGFPNGKGFPRLPILYNTSSTARERISQRLKNEWREKLNIEIDIVGLETKIYRDRVTNFDYAIATVAWYGDYPDVSTFTDKYLSSSKQNDTGWGTPEYDSLCDAATKEGDFDKRVRILEKAEHLLNTEVPIIPLYHYVNTSLNRDNVHGVKPNPRNMTIFKNVWVER
jgi:oligopeptide transport system substrate-binding protein